jgi:hypothetical protein
MTQDDDEDEWDRKIKDSLRYVIRLLIKHPNIDPARITEILGLKPKLSHVAGSPRMTLTGMPLPGLHQESAWGYSFQTERNRPFFQDVVRMIDQLEPHREFLHGIVNGGGTVGLIVHLPGDINIGSSFHWRDMARLSALHVGLGIEVFPEFN